MHNVANAINAKRSDPQIALRPGSPGNPPIALEEDSGQNFLRIQFISSIATSYNITMSCILVGESDDLILGTHKLYMGQRFINPNVFSTIRILLPPDILKRNKIHLIFIGDFAKDFEGKLKIPYRQTVTFDLKNKKTMLLDGINYDWIIKKMKNKKYPIVAKISYKTYYHNIT